MVNTAMVSSLAKKTESLIVDTSRAFSNRESWRDEYNYDKLKPIGKIYV